MVAVVPRIRKSLVEKGFDPKKVVTISNGFDSEYSFDENVLPDTLNNFFSEHSDEFTIVYGSGMGYAINLFTVIHAAEICRQKKNRIGL